MKRSTCNLDHPIVHVSWNDAAAYAAWAHKELPTKAQWEYAVYGGLEQKPFPRSDQLNPDGKHFCSIWQGVFPRESTKEDGYSDTSPVRAYPPMCMGFIG